MNFEVFTEVVETIKKQQEQSHELYKLGIDLANFEDPLHRVINHLIGSIYGKEGLETFYWWCCEKEFGTRADITMHNSDGILVCETIEDLWQWLEDFAVWDYELTPPMTDEERMEQLKKIFG